MNDSILRAEITASLDAVPVPSFDMRAVEERAAKAPAQRVQRPVRKPVWALAGVMVAVPVLAAAAAVFPGPQIRRAIVEQMHAWNVHTTSVTFQTAQPVSLQQAQSAAKFTLHLPAGLPNGTQLQSIVSNGSTGTSYSATYRLANGNLVAFQLQKALPKTAYVPWIAYFDTDNGRDRVTSVSRKPAYVWITGDEVVTVPKGALTPHQFAAVKNAMGAHDAPLAHP